MPLVVLSMSYVCVVGATISFVLYVIYNIQCNIHIQYIPYNIIYKQYLQHKKHPTTLYTIHYTIQYIAAYHILLLLSTTCPHGGSCPGPAIHLLHSPAFGNTRGTTLFGCLDRTVTAGGGRLLHDRLSAPLTDLQQINQSVIVPRCPCSQYL